MVERGASTTLAAMRGRSLIVLALAGCTMPNPAFEDGDTLADGSDTLDGQTDGSTGTGSSAGTSSADTLDDSDGESGVEASSSEGETADPSEAGETSGSTDTVDASSGETGGLECGPLVECLGECVDIASDELHCGDCRFACEPGWTCLDYECVPPSNKRVFVTSQAHVGSFPDGLLGADTFCNQLAEAAGLDGFYWSWLSNQRSWPAAFFLPGSTYVLVDGTVVAESLYQLLDGSLDHPINRDEHGFAQPAFVQPGCDVGGPVWSNTTFDGLLSAGPSCVEWTFATPMQLGQIGSSDATDAAWTHADCQLPCDKLLPIFCIET